MDQHVQTLLDDLFNDFKLNKSADVEIHVKGKVFKASKYILCMRSSVFAAMFNNDVKENQTNIVKITQFDAALVEKFLTYLYSAKVDGLSEIASDMFSIADYYDVKVLRQSCLEQMFQRLNRRNVLECFSLADKFYIHDLKQKSVEFMSKDVDKSTMHTYYSIAKEHSLEEVRKTIALFVQINLTDLLKTTEWKEFDPEFRLEMFQNFHEQYPMLELKQKERYKQVPFIFEGQTTSYNHTIYSLKNVGTKRVQFKVSIVNKNGISKKMHNCKPRSGYIEPTESTDLTINFQDYEVQTLISYGISSKDGNFDQNTLIRQLEIDPVKRYY